MEIRNMNFWYDSRDVISRDDVKDRGDIPIGSFNTITNRFEPVINTRGRAYGLRNSDRYRSRPDRSPLPE